MYAIVGGNADDLVRGVEDGVLAGALRPGETLPSVRGLARDLDLSPTTVAKAYRELRRRGVIVAEDRARTVVAHRPELRFRLAPTVPDGAVDLATGNPDGRLLPPLEHGVRSLPTAQYRYTDDVLLPALVDLARRAVADDGLDAEHLLIVSGGLDGIERVLEVHLRLGDRVGVEDPGYPGSLDLVRALGLEPVGIAVDDNGLVPEALDAALGAGLAALLHVPRAQNPTGAALSRPRAEELRRRLAAHPDLLVIEDDHAAPIAGVPAATLTTGRSRWAVVRSVAKWLGPQLRLGILLGDEATTDRVLARQRLGVGWVSQLLQHLVAVTWEQAEADGTLQRATAAYAERQQALLAELQTRGITATGRSGLNVWVPVDEEVPVVQGLAEHGWGVAAGEAFRLDSPPGVRVTTALLPTSDAAAFATDLERVLEQRLTGRRG